MGAEIKDENDGYKIYTKKEKIKRTEIFLIYKVILLQKHF